MDPVVHFEMPAEDKKRVASFYSKVFGWKMQHLGADMGEYLLAYTTEVDKNQMAKTPGAINGGFYKKSEESGNSTHFVISVKNLQESMHKVTQAGGKILDKPMDIPNIGKFVMFQDTEGNKVAMLQPLHM